jgi:hypothetical protein
MVHHMPGLEHQGKHQESCQYKSHMFLPETHSFLKVGNI